MNSTAAIPAEGRPAQDAMRSRGFMPLRECLDRLQRAMCGSLPRPVIVRQIKELHPKLPLRWDGWRNEAHESLYQAVDAMKLVVFLWPAVLDRHRTLKIGAGAVPVPVHRDLIRALKPIHGGLPLDLVAVRPGMWPRLRRKGFAQLPPDGVPVVRERDFLQWLDEERRKRKWPSQAGKTRKNSVGRPSMIRQHHVMIERIIPLEVSSKAEPVSSIARELNSQLAANGEEPVSEDAVGRALKRMYQETGDPRFARSGQAKAQLKLLDGLADLNALLASTSPKWTLA